MLAELTRRLSGLKSALVKGLLTSVAVLGVTAEFIDPVGDTLEDHQLLGGSLAAIVALILFDAISDATDKETSDVEVYGALNGLTVPTKAAFEATHVRIYFFGFTMQTLHEVIRDRLLEVADGSLRPRCLTLRIIVAHLSSPMNLPGTLNPAEDGSGHLTFGDSPVNRERMREDFTLEDWKRIRILLDGVHHRHPHIAISCEVRESPHCPQAKLYILNEERAIYGAYGIVKSSIARDGEEHRILDTAGFGIHHGDARYIGWNVQSATKSTRQVAQYHMAWFQNLWHVLEKVKPADPVILDPVWQPPPLDGSRA
ncbi:hypothetical protein ACFWZ2_13060 [Streptomyces sp. NPDC059002]|uniref:hypothetical protein n=1 Tax=Streptomyces sp. NPDC059002 TaxID=3346690 RepID=UPI003695881F